MILAHIEVFFVKLRRFLRHRHTYMVTGWRFNTQTKMLSAQTLACSRCFKIDHSFEDI